ncbi:hypothetical protein SPAN111604_10005 [Sphingomonas antarctica]|uniref:hypothetical protein n=1 Tax=Sphingomonas antarctica TaxID=2040274 RepID=UPI0039ED888F
MTDWTAPAKLIERTDEGSELAFKFEERGRGTLAELVTKVCGMGSAERARVVIDAGTQGTFNVGQILAMRGDAGFPADNCG